MATYTVEKLGEFDRSGKTYDTIGEALTVAQKRVFMHPTVAGKIEIRKNGVIIGNVDEIQISKFSHKYIFIEYGHAIYTLSDVHARTTHITGILADLK